MTTDTYRNAQGVLVRRVMAKELGYYGDKRRRPGDVFEMSVEHMKKHPEDDSLRLLPSWVTADTELTRRVLANQREKAAEKFAAAAIASSGTKGRVRKDSFIEAMRTGPTRDAKAEAAALASSSTAAANRKADEYAKLRPADVADISKEAAPKRDQQTSNED
jgi:hypothetical protein